MAALVLSSRGGSRPQAVKSSSSSQSESLVRRLSRGIKTANDALLSLRDGLSAEERERGRLRDERHALLRLSLKTAESFRQWQAAALELDALEGNDGWKRETDSGDYQPRLIEQRLKALDEARQRCDIRAMMHLVRTTLSRDLGGMGDVDLYIHSYVGTKRLIERYVDSAIQTIDAIVARAAAVDDARDLLDAMLLSRQSFGRSALLLSGGGTFGMTHIGVLKALYEASLLPRIISGASAGSIVCAVLCTRTDDQIPALIRDFPHGDLAVFGDDDEDVEGGGVGSALLGRLRRLLTEGSWADIRHLTRVMRGLTGDLTFQEAYNRTRRILNICVSSASVYESPRLLNYVTAPNVLIWSAVAASCSVPLFFNSSPLLVKDPITAEHHPWNPTPQRFIDGSVDNDLPMTRLAEMFNVNHFIVSQVNPHVVPFLSREDHMAPDDDVSASSSSSDGPQQQQQHQHHHHPLDWASTLLTLAKDEALHRLQVLADLGVLPTLMTKCRGILSQNYSGDITILPAITMHDLPRVMTNPTSDFLMRLMALGERATWPKLSRIRDRCAIELALDRAVHRLRTRVVFSQSQRDLRGLASTRHQPSQSPPRLPPLATESFAIATASAGAEPSSGLSGLSPAAESSALAGLGLRPRRRRSGGSVRVLPSLSGVVIPDSEATTDNGQSGTDKTGCADARRSCGNSPVALRKPPLKRASKSQIHVTQRHQAREVDNMLPLLSVPWRPRSQRAAGSETGSPRRRGLERWGSQRGETESHHCDAQRQRHLQHHYYRHHHQHNGFDDEGERLQMQASSPRGTATSPTDDMETSEQGHSSDADAELATEESDPDVFEGVSTASSPWKMGGEGRR
ncbi:Lipase 4 [Ophiocordyceps camponoti-floridani]|uniref:Patatin-like phospholipase domain-containing protein n=1 Tax=Ophiocordyceps camponoti-floridani TaxID=2030778 RepID=A0A8H4VG31_9HYPO|nr:Lipase 4 [Ophiocordyceps camponoti-floridani]